MNDRDKELIILQKLYISELEKNIELKDTLIETQVQIISMQITKINLLEKRIKRMEEN